MSRRLIYYLLLSEHLPTTQTLCLFNDAVNSSDYTASNDEMISNKKLWNSLIANDTAWAAQKTAPQTTLRCSGNVLTELLSSNDREIHR
jgi:hypothetical protein